MRRRASVISPLQIDEAATSEKSISTREFQPFFQRSNVQCIIPLSTFACLGTIIRDVTSLLFGLLGVTTSGMTEQTGGALFVDLPANMLGSFIMGVLVSKPRCLASMVESRSLPSTEPPILRGHDNWNVWFLDDLLFVEFADGSHARWITNSAGTSNCHSTVWLHSWPYGTHGKFHLWNSCFIMDPQLEKPFGRSPHQHWR
jgi:hypothetical protein